MVALNTSIISAFVTLDKMLTAINWPTLGNFQFGLLFIVLNILVVHCLHVETALPTVFWACKHVYKYIGFELILTCFIYSNFLKTNIAMKCVNMTCTSKVPWGKVLYC